MHLAYRLAVSPASFITAFIGVTSCNKGGWDSRSDRHASTTQPPAHGAAIFSGICNNRGYSLAGSKTMPYQALANLVVIIHLLFIVFVVLGGLLVFWRSWFAWIHLPVALYGLLIEWIGWVCPLTPLENRLRQRAGSEAYEGGFVDQYLLPLIYPAEYTRGMAIFLGAAVLAINLLVYGLYLWRR
jgi:hypothetical protein